MEHLIERIRMTPNCSIYPSVGVPRVTDYELPDDLRKFYELSSGGDLFTGTDYQISIVTPTFFVKANPVIAGILGADDISFHWFVIARGGEQFITIDLSPKQFGRCYDSFWDRHAVAGSCPVIALSFSDLLKSLLDSEGKHWFWLQDDFLSFGDAYG